MEPRPKAALGTQIPLPRWRAFWLAAHLRFQLMGGARLLLQLGREFVDYRLPGA